MEIERFILSLEENFDDLEPGTIRPETIYHDIDDWSSIHALIVIAMAETDYGVTITGEDLRSCKTVTELFSLIESRR